MAPTAQSAGTCRGPTGLFKAVFSVNHEGRDGISMTSVTSQRGQFCKPHCFSTMGQIWNRYWKSTDPQEPNVLTEDFMNIHEGHVKGPHHSSPWALASFARTLKTLSILQLLFTCCCPSGFPGEGAPSRGEKISAPSLVLPLGPMPIARCEHGCGPFTGLSGSR